MTARALLAAAVLLGSGAAWAHGGGLDAQGCHRVRATGERHCHGGGRPAPVPQRLAEPGGAAYYANCAAARAAGAAPLRRGDPGYARRLDRDGDGVACE